jgi:hypothetical protein
MSYRLAFLKTFAVIRLGNPFPCQQVFAGRFAVSPEWLVKPIAPARPIIPDKKLASEHEVVGTDDQVHIVPPKISLCESS